MAEHWCKEHQTPFFKKGNMKGFAHPILDENGEPIGKWCNEPKEEVAKPEPIAMKSQPQPQSRYNKSPEELVAERRSIERQVSAKLAFEGTSLETPFEQLATRADNIFAWIAEIPKEGKQIPKSGNKPEMVKQAEDIFSEAKEQTKITENQITAIKELRRIHKLSQLQVEALFQEIVQKPIDSLPTLSHAEGEKIIEAIPKWVTK